MASQFQFQTLYFIRESSNIKCQDKTNSVGKKKTYYVTQHHIDSLQRLPGEPGESVEEDILDLKGLS